MNYAKLKDELTLDEGRSLSAYKDTAGYWTIGVGHLLGTTPRMGSITDAECDALLDADIAHAEALARKCIGKFDALDDVRQRALVNMAFNRGGHMKESATITPAINAATLTGDWHSVAKAIMASPWAKQIGKRAERLAAMLESGTP